MAELAVGFWQLRPYLLQRKKGITKYQGNCKYARRLHQFSVSVCPSFSMRPLIMLGHFSNFHKQLTLLVLSGVYFKPSSLSLSLLHMIFLLNSHMWTCCLLPRSSFKTAGQEFPFPPLFVPSNVFLCLLPVILWHNVFHPVQGQFCPYMFWIPYHFRGLNNFWC